MEKCFTKVINLHGGLVNRTHTLRIAPILYIIISSHITYTDLLTLAN